MEAFQIRSLIRKKNSAIGSTGGIIKFKEGHIKLKRCCELARAQGIDYVWVDTCCIDKSSSTELSEAINSMYDYYKNSAVCYVFLEDVYSDSMGAIARQFQHTRWAKRGWCLQEIIAPEVVEFYDTQWIKLGSRRELAQILHQSTKIDLDILQREYDEMLDLSRYSIAQRMSWASRRETTRPEDIAYCLLGLFDVNMPLLYGEGSKKAFYRLQEEIMKHSMDQSIFAWKTDRTDLNKQVGVLAQSPADFASSANVIFFWADSEPFEMTNKGLRATLPAIVHEDKWYREVMLSCRYKDEPDTQLGLRIVEATDDATTKAKLYIRLNGLHEIRNVEKRTTENRTLETLYLARTDFVPTAHKGCCFRFNFTGHTKTFGGQFRWWRLAEPSEGIWFAGSRTLRLDPDACVKASESDISTYLVEYSEQAPTKNARIRFTIRRDEGFHCSRTTTYPIYACGFEDLTGERLMANYTCSRDDFKHTIQASKMTQPKVIMGEVVYEIGLNFIIEPLAAKKSAGSKARSSLVPAFVRA